MPASGVCRTTFRTASVALLTVLGAGGGASSIAGCGAPVLSRDGQLVFQQPGARGATVITANGVEFLDRNEVPQPIVRRSVGEAWRPATGFLLPADGVWRKTATPVPVQGPGLAVVLRSSDVLIPSWGGEILLRMDAIAPVKAFPHAAASVRPTERLVIVVDGSGADTLALADAAIDDLGGADRAGVVDATGARAVLPLVPGGNRTLLHATVERLLMQGDPSRGHDPSARDLTGAINRARGWLSAGPAGDGTARHVLVISDGVGAARGGALLAHAVEELTHAGVRLSAVGADALEPGGLDVLGAETHPVGLLDERRDAVEHAVPPPGDVVLDDVRLSISSIPEPARMIEVSGGKNALGLDADHLLIGEMYVGEARTEVARVALPPWVPGEPLDLTVTATYRDVGSGQPEKAQATIHCRYSADVQEIAEARHGDVIAYASALAMVRRLHRAFLGSEVDKLGGVRRLVAIQAQSLAAMSRDRADPAAAAQAEILSTLLGVMED
jgi:hypothetical protein